MALRRKRGFAVAAGVALVALVFASCSSKPSSNTTSSSASAGGGGSSGATSSSASSSAPASNFTACMVTDTGGIDDRSFNASSWEGVQTAAKTLSIKDKYLSSTAESDYVPNINAFIQQKCGIIVTVGFLMGDATKNAAKAHADQKFAIVDFNYSPALPNVLGLIFNTAQSGFLGGVLAAGMSKTGAVATFGGQKLPTVTIYMDGFYDGVQYYNQKHGKSVKVIGWDEKTQNGTFTGDFTDQGKGQQVAQSEIQQGADVIFPVAGNVGLGAAKAVQQSGGKAKLMWVDTDGCVSAPQYCGEMIGSVTKGIVPAVSKAVTDVKNGSFKGGNYVGTLANGGAALVLGSKLKSTIPSDLQSELKTVKQGIISGSIKVASPSQPKS